MCFEHDARPPIAPIAGGALDSSVLTLSADDGTSFSAFRARAAEPSGAGVVILPDVRGLHPYYEELALRFAENGIDAVAIDYFGRTAGLGRRDAGFEYTPHVVATTWAGISADIRAAVANLRSREGGGARRVFTIGFCFGGRVAFLSATLQQDLAGVIGFYGVPLGPGRNDAPAPVDVAEEMAGPILGLFGAADQAIPPAAIAAFDDALSLASVDHRLIRYPGAPHSFFDRKAEEFADASSQAWDEVLAFIGSDTAPAPAAG